MAPARVGARVRARGVLLAGVLVALGALAPAPLRAQAADGVVWVWLDDAAFAADAAPALGARALARRARLGIPQLDTDRPVPDSVVATLEAAGLRVRHRSRWLRAVSGVADATTVERLRGVRFVRRVTPVGAMSIPEPEPARAFPLELAPPPAFYGVAYDQVAQIGVPLAHELGYTGAGVVVAMLDTGFEEDHVALAGLSVIGRRDFIQGDSVVANEAGDPVAQSHHGTQVWSVLGGHDPDDFVGPAYGADFLLAKVDHLTLEPRADEDRWVAAIEWADSMGADVVSSSLGYRCFDDGFCWSVPELNGDVAPATIAADAAAARDIVVVNSAGNDGRNTPGSPADADSILAVGAVGADGALAFFSSTGPTGDGRIKPELVARGVDTRLASATAPTSYVDGSGTSFAAPLVGGAAALVREAWPQLNAMQVRAALLMSGSIQPANDSMGNGLPDVGSAIVFPLGVAPSPTAGNAPGGTVTSLAPRFSWLVPLVHPAATPVRYIVQVATDAAFTAIARADTVFDAQTLVLSTPLEAAEAYWWRVIAESAAGAVRTTDAVGPFAMQAWVRLATLNDPDGSFVSDLTPLLVWDPLAAPPPVGPLDFDVEILEAATGHIAQLIAGVADTSVQVLEPLEFNVPYRWRVIARTAGGAVDTTSSVAPFVVTSTDSPPVTALYQNFPNPFPRRDAPNTTIWFDLEREGDVELAVYDLHGRLVRRLIPDARQGCTGRLHLSAGAYGTGPQRTANPPCVSTSWDGASDAGERMAPGVYLIRLRAGGESHTVRTLYRP